MYASRHGCDKFCQLFHNFCIFLLPKLSKIGHKIKVLGRWCSPSLPTMSRPLCCFICGFLDMVRWLLSIATYYTTCRNHITREGMAQHKWQTQNLPREEIWTRFERSLNLRHVRHVWHTANSSCRLLRKSRRLKFPKKEKVLRKIF